MQNTGKALTGEEILRHVWKDEPAADVETVQMYVAYLREKIEAVRGDAEIAGGEEDPLR